MKLNVPYYCQRADVKDFEWQPRSCLVVSAKMMAEFLGSEVLSSDEWIKEGVSIGAWDGNYWKHDGVVRLLRNHGIFSYSQEFKTSHVDIINKEVKEGKNSDLFLEKGIEKIVRSLDSEVPVIVSIYKYFTEKDRHHAIVITGYEKDENQEKSASLEVSNIKGFYYNDPEMPEEKGGKDLFVSLNDFKDGWKRLSIFSDKF
jgi:hypothetical protein